MQEGTDGGEVFHSLEPQHAVTLELGTRGKAGPLTWDVVLYRSWVHHELLALNNAQGVPLGTVNADDTIHQGIEAGLEVELAHGLLVRGVRPDRRLDAKESKETHAKRKRTAWCWSKPIT